MRLRHVAVLTLVLLVSSAGAATRSRDGRELRSSDDRSQRLQARHCFAGCPQPRAGRGERPSIVLVVREGSVLEHSADHKIARWVAEYVTRQQLAGSGDRSRSAFAPDPFFAKGERAELADYRNEPPYDRGHCAPAADFGDQRLKDESFYLSNMTPQHRALNRQLWRALEDRTRAWIEARGSAYVITGGFFDDPKRPTTIGDNHVAVLAHYFKIVVAPRRETRQYESIAFVMDNRAPAKDATIAAFRVSIHDIETRTGLNFMLTPREERRLEGTVAPLWP